MSALIPLSAFRRAFCEAWEMGLNISRLPELLGISRPTYYKLLRTYRERYGLRVRLVPNVAALGYRILLIEGAATGSGGVLDLGSMHSFRLVYVAEAEAGAQSAIISLLGPRASAPLRVRRVYCPPTGTLVEAPSRAYRPRFEEILFAVEASEEFDSTRELAARLGVSWQRVTRLLVDSRRKGVIVAPLLYPEPGRAGEDVGVVLLLRGEPDPRLVWGLSDWPIVELAGEEGGGPHVLVGVSSISRILAIAASSGGVERILLSKSHPLPPLKRPHAVPAPPLRPWKRVLQRTGAS